MKNFNSQICTTREQSERLLALGLKKETADMCWIEEWGWDDDKQEAFCTGNYFVKPIDYVWDDKYINCIHAWSLHRLMCMIPNVIKAESNFENSFSSLMNISLSTRGIAYYYEDYDGGVIYQFENLGNLMEAAVSAIEWLIKEGYFNKEYLVNQAQAEIEEHCKGVLEYLDYIKGEED